MKVASSITTRRGRGVPKATAAPQDMKPLLPPEYQAIFTKNGRPMVILEADATISLANAEFERLSGYTREEIEGNKKWTEFVGRGDRKRMREYHLLRKSDPLLAPRCFEFRFLDRRGKVKNIVLTIGQIPGTNKSMASLLDVTDLRRAEEALRRDSKDLKERVKERTAALAKANKALQGEITRRKRAEEALRESEGKYRAIFDSMLEGYFEVDLTGKFTFFNEAVSTFFGYSRDELMGLNYQEFTSPKEAQRLYQAFSRVYGSGNPHEINDYEIIKKDGSIGIAEFSVSLLRNAAGKPIGFRGVTRDVTEKRKTQEALQQSEESYRKILKLAPGGITISRIEDSRYLLVNAAFCQHTGYSAEETIGRTPLELNLFVDLADRERLGEAIRQHGRADGLEIQFRAKDGTILDDLVSARPIRFQGEECLLVVATNINTLKEAQQALHESEARYRNILENIEEGYYEVDLAGNYTFVNETVCKHHNRPREELLSMNNSDHASPETVKRLESIFTEIYRTGVPTKIVDNEVIRKDGTTILVEISASLLRNAAGEPIGFYGVSRDRTEQKKVEVALRQSEEKYRNILATIVDGYYEVDLAGNFTFLNDSHVEALGYSKDELMEMNNRDYMNKEDAKRVYQAFNRVYVTGIPDRGVEYEAIRKDGTRRYVESSAALIKDAGGQRIGFRGIMRDTTERKKAEEALRQSEEKYRTILESIEDGYGENDLHGTITFCNEALLRILGYPKEDLKSLNYKNRKYMDKENAEKVYQVYTDVYTTGKPNRGFQYEIIAQDGTRRHLESSISLRKDAGGQPVGFQGVVRDITERKRAEEALSQSEERYRTIIETIQESYYEMDLTGLLTFANDALYRHLGYSREELIGKDLKQYQDEAAAKKVFQVYSEIYRTGEPVKAVESEYIRKDRTKGTYELSASLIRDAEGKPIGFRGVSRDVTERKRAEEQLQRYAAELERSNEEVKNFAYIVSHDLRVPLVNLKGYTSELRSALGVIGPHCDAALLHLDEEKQSEVAMALHEDVPEALEFISTSVSRMDSFINAVLVLSRLGRQELKPEPLDMEALVQQSLEILSHQIQEQGITVTVGPLPEVVADRTSMEQIVGNILGNAVKYLDPERPAQIKVTAKPNNTEQIFRIQDTGRGIAKDDMHKVFAPFRRAGKQDTPGEGMGLAYVQTLVRRHGGRIWCESEAGKGTTFIFTIATPSGKGAHDA